MIKKWFNFLKMNLKKKKHKTKKLYKHSKTLKLTPILKIITLKLPSAENKVFLPLLKCPKKKSLLKTPNKKKKIMTSSLDALIKKLAPFSEIFIS
jgi:hypothetical protein